MKEWIKDILLAVVIALVVIQFIKPTVVKQSSMEPNVHENDYLLVSKQSYKLFGEPQRGDVVVVHSDLVQESGIMLRPDCCAPCCFNHFQKTPMIRSCLLRRTSMTAAEKRSPIQCSCCSTPVHSMLSASRST